jgi:hypothetical protein
MTGFAFNCAWRLALKTMSFCAFGSRDGMNIVFRKIASRSLSSGDELGSKTGRGPEGTISLEQWTLIYEICITWVLTVCIPSRGRYKGSRSGCSSGAPQNITGELGDCWSRTRGHCGALLVQSRPYPENWRCENSQSWLRLSWR